MRLKDSAQITNSLYPSKDFGLGHKGLKTDREKKNHIQIWLLDKGGALGKIKKCLAFSINIKEKKNQLAKMMPFIPKLVLGSLISRYFQP